MGDSQHLLSVHLYTQPVARCLGWTWSAVRERLWHDSTGRELSSDDSRFTEQKTLELSEPLEKPHIQHFPNCTVPLDKRTPWTLGLGPTVEKHNPYRHNVLRNLARKKSV